MPAGLKGLLPTHAQAIHLPGIGVTYYDDPSAPAQLSSYASFSAPAFVRQASDTFTQQSGGWAAVSPSGEWLASTTPDSSQLGSARDLTITDRATGRHHVVRTPGFGIEGALTWGDNGTRLMVTAVRGQREIGFAWAEAPGFRLHLVRVRDAGFASSSQFFAADPAGTGAIFNVQTGPQKSQTTGPLRFVTGTGAVARAVPGAIIPELARLRSPPRDERCWSCAAAATRSARSTPRPGPRSRSSRPSATTDARSTARTSSAGTTTATS